ncbi:MAG: RNA polymerase-binding protein DksA [Alphaproteobacteria bacterium]|nr:RNA polymerase-binding protein DksA [Alphaproteobacteria bacterium]
MAKQDYKTLELAAKYVPKKSEPYMCLEQRAYFYQILMAQKQEITDGNSDVLNVVRNGDNGDAAGVGDDADNASASQALTMNLRMSERDNNLLKKIDAALERLENGKFGFSVISGDPIGIPRLLARPLATMTVEEQEEYEANK